MEHKVRLGITQGDINGVGYEVIIKTLADSRILDFCTPVVYGSSKVAAFHRKMTDVDNFSFNIVRTADEANPRRANLINVMSDEAKVDLGQLTDMAGQGAVDALRAAVADLKAGKLDALLTAPFNKQNVQSDSYHFPGHTEFLAQEFEAKEVLMLLVSDTLRVGVVTGHIPLSKVSGSLTPELIFQKLEVLQQSLQCHFGIRKPRIAVLGLNPHAGDNGLLGTEEQDIILPALALAAKAGILAFGPYPADGFFGSDSLSRFDAVLAMYHDQGLAPFKALAFRTGVNFTAGLPIVRSSPAHGTAYDIAGKNMASPDSFREALYLACDVVKHRREHAELTQNPLCVTARKW